jgi:Transglycosylase SLT domain
MFRQITGTIGNMMQNLNDDVLQVKSALERLGRFDFASKPEPHSYVTKELDGSIREYQRDRGLKIDGWMRPGGETERSLSRDMRDKERKGSFLQNISSSSLPPRPEFRTSAGIRVNLDKISTGINNLNQASEHKAASDAKNKPPEPFGPPVPALSSQERKKIIINDRTVGFPITSNPDAKSDKPWYERLKNSQVKKYENIIEQRAKKADIDPDLVKAVMHMETTHGKYDRYADSLGINKSILPMNIYAKNWKDLGFSRDDLRNPETNIQVGIALLKRIKKQVPDGDIKKIATLYNELGATKVSDYGARVESIYKEKPWRRK